MAPFVREKPHFLPHFREPAQMMMTDTGDACDVIFTSQSNHSRNINRVLWIRFMFMALITAQLGGFPVHGTG